jgi:hypothetical protein
MRMFFFFLAFVSAIWSWTVGAAPLSFMRFGETSKSALIKPVAALGCTRLINRSGRTVIINRCSTCRNIKVNRKRPGSPLIYRSFIIPKSSEIALPFRGPGQSRITEDSPCQNTKEAQKPGPAEKADQEKKCVKFIRTQDGKISLVNECNTCRKVDLARVGGVGGGRGQTVAIGPKSYAPIPARGAESARILKETPCK